MNKFSGNAKFEGDRSMRLDLFLVSLLPSLSRSLIQKAINNSQVTVNGKPCKSNYVLKKTDKIIYCLSDREINPGDILPEKIKLDILFENKDVIVINKQRNLIAHPTPNNLSNTLVNALINHDKNISEAVYDKNSSISLIRPGIVHRLDKDTTGVMIIAKNSETLRFLSAQIKSHKVIKKYLGLCCGQLPKNNGAIVNHLGRDPKNRQRFTNIGKEKGKEAITEYRLKKIYSSPYQTKLSLVEFTLITGRTHQIRTQSKLFGVPIIGDPLYNTQQSIAVSKYLKISNQLLHAHSLKIFLPGEESSRTFAAPIPQDFKCVINKLHTIPAFE